MSSSPTRLEASRERFKAALDLTRRQLQSEVGAAPRGRMVLPLVAGAAGLALALLAGRMFMRRTAARLEQKRDVDIDLM